MRVCLAMFGLWYFEQRCHRPFSGVDHLLLNTKRDGFSQFHCGIGSAYGDEMNVSLQDNLKSVCFFYSVRAERQINEVTD